nr:ribosomal protein S11 [Cyanidioschyzonaceae sp. 1 FvB-2021]
MKCIIHVHLSLNNIIISVTDDSGDVLGWSSLGSVGFKGSKRSTVAAISFAVLKILALLKKNNATTLSVYFKGLGKGSEVLIDLLDKCRVNVDILANVTEIPHNGCRPRKKRRL